MHELVARVCRVVVLARETQVGAHPKPDRQRGDTRDKDPLADVEFLPKNDQWPLDVLLDHPDCQAGYPHTMQHLVDIRQNLNASAP